MAVQEEEAEEEGEEAGKTRKRVLPAVQGPTSKVQRHTFKGQRSMFDVQRVCGAIALLSLTLFTGPIMAEEINTYTDTQDDGFSFPECPGTPNCVSSLAKDPARQVDPFPVKGDPAQSMDLLKSVIISMPRTTIVSGSGTRIESEFRSFLGFVDDVLFVLGPDGDIIHVRSASRKGTWDLGVNRRRVERIRELYIDNRLQPLEGATERPGD